MASGLRESRHRVAGKVALVQVVLVADAEKAAVVAVVDVAAEVRLVAAEPAPASAITWRSAYRQ